MLNTVSFIQSAHFSNSVYVLQLEVFTICHRFSHFLLLPIVFTCHKASVVASENWSLSGNERCAYEEVQTVSYCQ